MTKYIFDLDGTVTKEETLPIISKYFNVSKEMEELTKRTVQGEVTFVESFIKRCYILGNLSVKEVANLLENSSENKITLITCIANRPNQRLCVQAVEI